MLGQYVGNPNSSVPAERVSYLDEPKVTKGSLQSTFATTVLKVDNERWSGVPFIIRAGKGLNERKTQIEIQFKNVDRDIFGGKASRNRLVIRVGKSQFLNAKIMSKKPGFTSDVREISIDFDFDREFKGFLVPTAYERLIMDVFRGSHLNFVRSDELSEAWRIFTPVLHEIEEKMIEPCRYT